MIRHNVLQWKFQAKLILNQNLIIQMKELCSSYSLNRNDACDRKKDFINRKIL